MLSFSDIFNEEELYGKPAVAKSGSAETTGDVAAKTDFTPPLRIDTSAISQQQKIDDMSGTLGTDAPSAYSSIPLLTASYTPTTARSRNFTTNETPLFPYQTQVQDVFDVQSNNIVMAFSARMDGGFFQFDGKWTCYRRNYFRIQCTFSATNAVTGQQVFSPKQHEQYVMMPDSSRSKVLNYRVSLSAVCNFGKPVDLVMQNSKKSASSIGNNSALAISDITPGGALTAVPRTPSLHSMDHSTVTFDKLQFRTATSNNGKRRAIQQYFRTKLDLWAVCENGCVLKIHEAISDDVVVRGRSPGHYADLERIKERRKSISSNTPTSANGRRNSWNGLYVNIASQPLKSGLTSAPVLLSPGDTAGSIVNVNGVPVPLNTPVSPLAPASFWNAPISSRPIYKNMAQNTLETQGEQLRSSLERIFQNGSAFTSSASINTAVSSGAMMMDLSHSIPNGGISSSLLSSATDSPLDLTPIAESISMPSSNSVAPITDDEFLSNFNFAELGNELSSQLW